MTRRLLLSLALAAGLLSLGVATASNDMPGPEQVVQSVADRLSAALDANREHYNENPEAVEDLVRKELLPHLDVHYSARLILGRAGREATPEQVNAFGDTTSNILLSRYASGLLEYRDREQIEVMPLRGELNERMTRVRTRVRLLNGKQVPVDYVFRKTDDGWKAFDVIVEGISYVTTYRNQLKPRVEAEGLDRVIAQLADGSLDLNQQD